MNGNSEALFTPPKRLTIRQKARRFILAEIDHFEPHRFFISRNSHVSIDYESQDKCWGALYSADLEQSK